VSASLTWTMCRGWTCARLCSLFWGWGWLQWGRSAAGGCCAHRWATTDPLTTPENCISLETTKCDAGEFRGPAAFYRKPGSVETRQRPPAVVAPKQVR